MDLPRADSGEARLTAQVLGDVKAAKAVLAAAKVRELRDGTAQVLMGATAQERLRVAAIAARGVQPEAALRVAMAREKRPGELKDDLALAPSGLMDATARGSMPPELTDATVQAFLSRDGWVGLKYWGVPAASAGETGAGQKCQASMEAKSRDVMEYLGVQMGHLAAKLVLLFVTTGRWGGWVPDQHSARHGNYQDWYCVGWANRMCQNRRFRGQHLASRLQPRGSNVANLSHLGNRDRDHFCRPTDYRGLVN